MSVAPVIALSLAALVAVLAFVTRRKPVDPLARAARRGVASAPGATADKKQGALAVRTVWKLMRNGSDAIAQVAQDLRAGRKAEAVTRMREATGLELADATRVVDEIEAQIASSGPLAKLLADFGTPPPK